MPHAKTVSSVGSIVHSELHFFFWFFLCMQVSDERRKLEMYRSWCDLVDRNCVTVMDVASPLNIITGPDQRTLITQQVSNLPLQFVSEEGDVVRVVVSPYVFPGVQTYDVLLGVSSLKRGRMAVDLDTEARNKPVYPNDYHSIWTGIRDFLAKQQGYVTWSNRPPQPNNRNRPGPLAQMFASIGSQPHQAQVQAYQAQARGQP
jgi:hypothetical protein